MAWEINAVAHNERNLVGGTSVPPKTPNYGVGSAVKELLDAANTSQCRAVGLRSALGIAIPSDGSNPAAPSSLVDAIAQATQVIRRANGDVEDCIQHLTS